MIADPFAPIDGARPAGSKAKQPPWVAVMPVPADAPKAPVSHFRLGKPVATWCYRSAGGEILGYVSRFDAADGKVFRPLTYARPATGGAAKWRWESWPLPRPLYGLQGLAQRPEAPVLVTEGEKGADAAGALLPAMVVVTSPNGSKGAGAADWSPLRDRRVTVWPDADTAGLAYAQDVAKAAIAAGALSVVIVSPPSGCKVGWDAADALAEGWTESRAKELIANAVAAPNGGAPEGGAHRRTPQRDILIGFTDGCEFWHDANRGAFVTYPVNSHREHWPVRSREFRMWLSAKFYENTGVPLAARRSRMASGSSKRAPFTTVRNMKRS
jgi:putative DNA primase/helicase